MAPIVVTGMCCGFNEELWWKKRCTQMLAASVYWIHPYADFMQCLLINNILELQFNAIDVEKTSNKYAPYYRCIKRNFNPNLHIFKLQRTINIFITFTNHFEARLFINYHRFLSTTQSLQWNRFKISFANNENNIQIRFALPPLKRKNSLDC